MNSNEAHYSEKLQKLQKMIETKKKRTGNIDCAVVMDLTASMQPYLEKMKIELSKLIAQLSEDNKEISLRFAFIGYKDFCDASGGGDIPEDVVGGLNQALKLSWRADSHKIVILVADAPTHGRQYHVGHLGDDFPKGHPDEKITLEAMMEKFAKIKATFLVFRLDNQTEKMFEIMKTQYKQRQQKLRFVDLREILRDENQYNYERKASIESLNSDIDCQEECKIPKEKSKSKAKVFKEDEPKKLIRASSIINLKITEKIMVESEVSDCEGELNEEWNKK